RLPACYSHSSDHNVELLMRVYIERYLSSGPRAMALVPSSQRELLEALKLPDSNLYDQLHTIQQALAEHRRSGAMELSRQMQEAAPEHRLTLTARRAIASYDSNTP